MREQRFNQEIDRADNAPQSQKAHPLGECALKAVYRGQMTTA
jgi:hypothetical protein